MKKKQAITSMTPGQFAYEGLDRVLHEKARLGIMTSLAARREGLLFSELKELCSLTDGNLSRHLQTLEEAGYVEIWKNFKNRRPQTLARLTARGREHFLAYLAELERVVRQGVALKSALAAESEGTEPMKNGWAPA